MSWIIDFKNPFILKPINKAVKPSEIIKKLHRKFLVQIYQYFYQEFF